MNNENNQILQMNLIKNEKPLNKDFLIKVDCSDFMKQINMYKTILVKKDMSVEDLVKLVLDKMKIDYEDFEKYFLKNSDTEDYIFQGHLVSDFLIINKKIQENANITLIFKDDYQNEINQKKKKEEEVVKLVLNEKNGFENQIEHLRNKLKNLKRSSMDSKVTNYQIEKKSKEEKIFKKITNLLQLLQENQKTNEKTEVEEFIEEINVLIEKFKPLIQNEKKETLTFEEEDHESVIISEIFKLLSNFKLVMEEINNQDIKKDFRELKILITEYFLLIQEIFKKQRQGSKDLSKLFLDFERTRRNSTTSNEINKDLKKYNILLYILSQATKGKYTLENENGDTESIVYDNKTYTISKVNDSMGYEGETEDILKVFKIYHEKNWINLYLGINYFIFETSPNKKYKYLIYRYDNLILLKEVKKNYLSFYFNDDDLTEHLVFFKETKLLTNMFKEQYYKKLFKFLKENDSPIFGANYLSSIKYIPKSLPILLPIYKCIERIEKDLDEEGIYRISGSVKQIKRLISLYNLGDDPDLSKLGVHTITSVLTTFFLDMPNSIFDFENLMDSLINLQSDENDDKILEGMKNIVSKYPFEVQNLFKFLFKHLNNVSSNSSKNQMNAKNLSIVFCPCLFKFIQNGYSSQNICIERFINHYEKIFN
jgi:hypothetical protein